MFAAEDMTIVQALVAYLALAATVFTGFMAFITAYMVRADRKAEEALREAERIRRSNEEAAQLLRDLASKGNG